MLTQGQVAMSLNAVSLPPNKDGDILTFEEVVVERIVDEDVIRASEYRLIWNEDEHQSFFMPENTNMASLISKATEDGWFK